MSSKSAIGIVALCVAPSALRISSGIGGTMVLRCSGRFSVMVATGGSVLYSSVSNSCGVVDIAAVESLPSQKSRWPPYRCSYRNLISMLRIIQWATGSVGGYAVAAVHDHPDLELVGALVYSVAKAGRDVGHICGLATSASRPPPTPAKSPRWTRTASTHASPPTARTRPTRAVWATAMHAVHGSPRGDQAEPSIRQDSDDHRPGCADESLSSARRSPKCPAHSDIVAVADRVSDIVAMRRAILQALTGR